MDKTSPVRHLHFEEAAELAYFGAKILHPTCIQPAKYANIPVRLLNTMDPTAPGTLISNDTEKGKIKAVAAKDNITAIKIKSSRMLLAHGFLRKVFEIFESNIGYLAFGCGQFVDNFQFGYGLYIKAEDIIIQSKIYLPVCLTHSSKHNLVGWETSLDCRTDFTATHTVRSQPAVQRVIKENSRYERFYLLDKSALFN